MSGPNFDAGTPSLAPAETGATTPAPPRRRRWGRAGPLPGPICHLITKPLVALVAGAALAGCTLSYDGPTNQWRDKATGVVVGCSAEEDEPIVPCDQLPGSR